jgi:F-type H+-transporting ATPase subunit c
MRPKGDQTRLGDQAAGSLPSWALFTTGISCGYSFRPAFPSTCCRWSRRSQGQFGNLIFGFAVTEALGIFSLLVALLLLFAL